MANKRLTEAFTAIHKVTEKVGGDTGYAAPGSDEAKALKAFLFILENHVTNIDDIASIMRKGNPQLVAENADGFHGGSDNVSIG